MGIRVFFNFRGNGYCFQIGFLEKSLAKKDKFISFEKFKKNLG